MCKLVAQEEQVPITVKIIQRTAGVAAVEVLLDLAIQEVLEVLQVIQVVQMALMEAEVQDIVMSTIFQTHSMVRAQMAVKAELVILETILVEEVVVSEAMALLLL